MVSRSLLGPKIGSMMKHWRLQPHWPNVWPKSASDLGMFHLVPRRESGGSYGGVANKPVGFIPRAVPFSLEQVVDQSSGISEVPANISEPVRMGSRRQTDTPGWSV